MSSKKTVLVNKIKQLIDLNGDKVNYNLNFTVTSKDGLPFDTIVVSQAKLDSGEELEYKKVLNGIINGNIVADKDVYQNYFLLLKAENPVECTVEIDIKDIPVNEQFLNQQVLQEQSIQKQRLLVKKTDTKSNFNTVVIIIVIVCIIALAYYFLYVKKSKNDGFGGSGSDTEPLNICDPVPVMKDTIELNLGSDTIELQDNTVAFDINPLLSKINNMKIF